MKLKTSHLLASESSIYIGTIEEEGIDYSICRIVSGTYRVPSVQCLHQASGISKVAAYHICSKLQDTTTMTAG